MHLRAVYDLFLPECPLRGVPQAAGCWPPSSQDLTSALNCSLLSQCPARVRCLARVSSLIEARQA